MKTALMIAFLFMGQNYRIELAVTPVEQATGLMYRQSWADDSQGMLFINDKPRPVSFWMKNTHLNLTMMYLDSDYNLLEIYTPKPLDLTSVPSKATNVLYVLELNPALEGAVRSNWTEFKTALQQAVTAKEKEITRLRRPL